MGAAAVRGEAAAPDGKFHTVAAGDTLYSIAWESGNDYRELAAWNDIPRPYLIKPGQKVRLTKPTQTAGESSRRSEGPATHVVVRGETLYRIAITHDIRVQDLARWNDISPPYHLQVGQRLKLVGPDEPSGRAAPGSQATVKAPAKKPVAAEKPKSNAVPRPATGAADASIDWAWPADGNVIGRFGDGNSKGIAIVGRKGQPIRASGSGQVVYQGGGLRGYGQLIIVKHNATYLSAYAHCDRILVKEGDVVKRGQKIADMGSSGTDRTKLHFEIRRHGTPVNPLSYLPRK
jgi:lipoprotein NlpD